MPAAVESRALAKTLEKAAGYNQGGLPYAALPVAPVMRVLSPTGVPVSGIRLSAAVTSGGIQQTAVTTGADGAASFGTWTPGPAAAAQALIIGVVGVPAKTVTFTSIASSDTTAPATIALATGTRTASSVELILTAPGDDGATGTITAYELRYSRVHHCPQFHGCQPTQRRAHAPGRGNQPERDGQRSAHHHHVFFAIKASDEVGNTSGISESVSAHTPPVDTNDTTAPTAITTLTAG